MTANPGDEKFVYGVHSEGLCLNGGHTHWLRVPQVAFQMRTIWEDDIKPCEAM